MEAQPTPEVQAIDWVYQGVTWDGERLYHIYMNPETLQEYSFKVALGSLAMFASVRKRKKLPPATSMDVVGAVYQVEFNGVTARDAKYRHQWAGPPEMVAEWEATSRGAMVEHTCRSKEEVARKRIQPLLSGLLPAHRAYNKAPTRSMKRMILAEAIRIVIEGK